MSKGKVVSTVAFLAVAVAGLLLTSAHPVSADGGYCVFTVECDEEGCEVTDYSCAPFVSGDCDADCDWEAWYCEQECAMDPESTPIECDRACRAVFLGCVQACIPEA